MKVRLLAIGIPVCAVLWVTAIGFARERTVWRLLQFIGAVFLLVVVLAHIAEAYHLIPWMHWGRKR
jgi:hypothetical protein